MTVYPDVVTVTQPVPYEVVRYDVVQVTGGTGTADLPPREWWEDRGNALVLGVGLSGAVVAAAAVAGWGAVRG